jgi:ubiquinone/menaquinone biosynthesis C-methylase UbiE
VRIGLRLAKYRRKKYSRGHRDFYEQFFVEKHIHQSRYDLRARLRRHAIAHALFKAAMPERPRIVDVGCGVGDVIESMPPGALKIGLAYSQADLDLARKACDCSVCFVKANAFELPFSSASLDAVLCLEVIEHLPDDRAAMGELARVLKPGGHLLISEPGHYYFPEYFELMGHYRHYSRQSLAGLLSGANLRVIRYVDSYPLINTLHFYPHALLEGAHRVLNKYGAPADSLYVRPHLGRWYRRIAQVLMRCTREREQSALAASERSTFVLAQRHS